MKSIKDAINFQKYGGLFTLCREIEQNTVKGLNFEE